MIEWINTAIEIVGDFAILTLVLGATGTLIASFVLLIKFIANAIREIGGKE